LSIASFYTIIFLVTVQARFKKPLKRFYFLDIFLLTPQLIAGSIKNKPFFQTVLTVLLHQPNSIICCYSIKNMSEYKLFFQ